MAANIYVYCPSGDDGPPRYVLSDEIETYFGSAGGDCGGGVGINGFNMAFELADGEDPHAWADRLKPFLASLGVRPKTFFDVFPDGWEPGMEWRRVEVYGEDRRRTDRPGPSGVK